MSTITLPKCPLCGKGVLIPERRNNARKPFRNILIRCNKCCRFMWVVIREWDPNTKPVTKGLQYHWEEF